jgi:heavy metal translocating P-type ATPase
MKLRELEGFGLFLWPATALLAGLAAWAWGDQAWADRLWLIGTGPILVVLILTIIRALAKGQFGLDIIAAFSMAGALWLNEYLAGIIVALMFSGGTMLESFAQYRARRDMSALLARNPHLAHRYDKQGLRTVALDAVVPGDRLLVKAGETVPADGTITGSSPGVLDESALTGEPLPVTHRAGSEIMSGSVNAAGPFDMLVTQAPAQSTYAGIIRLVDEAQNSKAPAQRLADRYALYFLALTAIMAALAGLLSDDPRRILAVLVIATPCPLILGVPVAIVSGLSAAARHGVLIKSGGALERLGRVRVLLFDKTGTLTQGRPDIISINAAKGFTPDQVLTFAASLEQVSHHGVAETITAAAIAKGLQLQRPTRVKEAPGAGLSGTVAAKQVACGSAEFVFATLKAKPRNGHALGEGDGVALTVFVSIAGKLAGAIRLADSIRPESENAISNARKYGIRRFIMVTGDRRDVADEVGARLGVDEVHAELKPAEKVAIVAREQAIEPVLMVGDGMNDAPALAAAEVGIAMGARGSAASAQAADAVIVVDKLDRVADALRIARHSRKVALQSVGIGMGLSFVGMIAAALGYLGPVEGALAQEVIDAAAVLNALRALRS